MIRSKTRLAALLPAIGLALYSPAQPISIVNAGFEADVVTPGAFVVLQPQGWSPYDPAGMINQNHNAIGVIRPSPGMEYFINGAPEGVNAAIVYLAGPQAGEAGLQQTLTATLQANTRYRLSVGIGNIASGTSLPGSSGGEGVFYDLDGFPGYRIDLLAGGAVVASDNNSLDGTIPEGEFRTAIVVHDTGPDPAQLGQPLGVCLVNLKHPGTADEPNIEVDFDDVQLTASPSPTPPLLGIEISNSFPMIRMTGTTGAAYRLEFSSVLPATNWVILTNIALPASPFTVLDTDSLTNHDARYYRAVSAD